MIKKYAVDDQMQRGPIVPLNEHQGAVHQRWRVLVFVLLFAGCGVGGVHSSHVVVVNLFAKSVSEGGHVYILVEFDFQ